MKIHYKHLLKDIVEKPSINDLSLKLFQLGHEHEINDGIFEIDFTPNRGDCISKNGLLRDLSAFYNISETKVVYKEKIPPLNLDFRNEAKSICPKITFLKIEIEGEVSSYKKDLKGYFEDLDIKKTNFFTDVSNFLLYETGQPTHCYDLSKFNGDFALREVEGKHEFETLFNTKIMLTGKNAVFQLDNKIANLAGVIGGKKTACSQKTKSILLECATFIPESIIGKTIKYDIKSDAAYRFERGVDPNCHEYVIRRYIDIIKEHANVVNIKIYSSNDQTKSEILIPFNVRKINNIIGTNLSQGECEHQLERLNFKIKNNLVHVPSYRNDIYNQNDLSEEVARVIGYDQIKSKPFVIKNKPKIKNDLKNNLRLFLSDNGFCETINYPFINIQDADSIIIDNPLDINKKYMRTSLKESLLQNLLYNERRQKDSVKLFEISDVYFKSKKLEPISKLAIIGSGRVGNNYEQFSKKISRHYFDSIFQQILVKDISKIEIIERKNLNTKISSEIIYLEVNILKSNFTNYLNTYQSRHKNQKVFTRYKKISEYPYSIRDLSFSLKKPFEIDDLQKIIFSKKNSILKEVFIFDYYHNAKKEEVKLGFRFKFQSDTKTLEDFEIEEVMNDIIKNSCSLKGVNIPGL